MVSIEVLSALASREVEVSLPKLQLLAELPSTEWTLLSDLVVRNKVDENVFLGLADDGLVITDLDRHAPLLEKERAPRIDSLGAMGDGLPLRRSLDRYCCRRPCLKYRGTPEEHPANLRTRYRRSGTTALAA